MTEFEDVDGEVAGDPDGDPIFEGTQKINANTELLRLSVGSFSSTLPLDRLLTHYVPWQLFAKTVFSIGASPLFGGRCVMDLTGGSIAWPEDQVQEIQGSYNPSIRNRVEVVNVGGTTAGSATLRIQISPMPRAPLTGMVFRQDARFPDGPLNSFADALSFNANSPNPPNETLFSRMGDLERYRQRDDYFYFRLRYYRDNIQTGSDIRWRQRSNPVVSDQAYEAVEGYEALSGTDQLTLNDSGQTTPFGGLCLTSVNRFSTWHGHPGQVSNAAIVIATMGVTLYAQEVGAQFIIPGVSVIDNAVELYAERPQTS